ncbi:MAG: DUF805 domain-containing protein [Propionibacteriaceae bacterium]|jgi:uncharacterized membrane protein YhaH (DUF805 family)|nr:DUF805 domain-containing protein [Propionibacteriaceae bacterium]
MTQTNDPPVDADTPDRIFGGDILTTFDERQIEDSEQPDPPATPTPSKKQVNSEKKRREPENEPAWTPSTTYPTLPDRTTGSQDAAVLAIPQGDPGALDKPWYGIGFVEAIKRAFRKYATFSGRASRGEFWWFTLFTILVDILLTIAFGASGAGFEWLIADEPVGGNPLFDSDALRGVYGVDGAIVEGLTVFFYLATFLPSLSIGWRRLHDTNKSGWWSLLFGAPVLGSLGMVVSSQPIINGAIDLVATVCYFAGIGFLIGRPNPDGERFDRP